MRIAIPAEDGKIFSPFTETKAFTLYNLDGSTVVSTVTIPSVGGGEEDRARLLRSARADVVICGGVTAGARRALGELGIAVYPGFGGRCDDAAAAFASGAMGPGHVHDCASCTENCGEGGCHHDHGAGGCC